MHISKEAVYKRCSKVGPFFITLNLAIASAMSALNERKPPHNSGALSYSGLDFLRELLDSMASLTAYAICHL